MERSGKIQLWRTLGGAVNDKLAELAETYDMKTEQPPDGGKHGGPILPIKKTSSAVHQDSIGDEQLAYGIPLTHENPTSLPQTGTLHPVVDVSSKNAPKKLTEKKAEYYALPNRQMYPLDNYLQVKAAAAYFNDTYKFMPPQIRHEYCTNLVKRAHALDIYVDETVEKYGSATYAADHDFNVCMDARRSNLTDEFHLELLDKVAAMKVALDPEMFAHTLQEFDKVACLQQHYGEIPDAYFTTFGKTAAEESKTDPTDSILVGNEYITKRDLVEFAKMHSNALKLRFGDEFTCEFQQDPVGILKSLPRDQKLVIMRMANTSESQVHGASDA